MVFAPDANNPRKLLEITLPGDGRVVPVASDMGGWLAEMASLQANPAASKSELTDLVRVARMSNVANGGNTTPRAALRFVVEQRPLSVEWSEYRSGNRTWDSIRWVQGLAGANSGLAQTWVRLELQLTAGLAGATSGEVVLPFFGSAALYYQLTR